MGFEYKIDYSFQLDLAEENEKQSEAIREARQIIERTSKLDGPWAITDDCREWLKKYGSEK